MNYNFFTFQSFLPCQNSRGSFCVWGYLFSCFPTPYCWMLSPLQSWGRWVRSGGPPVLDPSSSTDPPNTGIPRTGPYHPPPQPTLIPYFPDISHFRHSRCSKKCIIQLQQNSKLHALSKIHSSEKVSWQIWLLAYIPRGFATRSWGRLIQNPPETHFMAQFCAREWVLNIFDMLSSLT